MVYLKYQIYENVHSCFGAEKSEFPDIPENLWNKRKDKGKEETNKKRIKELKFHVFLPVHSYVSITKPTIFTDSFLRYFINLKQETV